MKFNKFTKQGLTILMSLNMAFSGMLGDMGWLQINAETVDDTVVQEIPAAVSDTVPVLSTIRTRNPETNEQTELYRFHIAGEETISLRDALIRSGCTSEEDADAFIGSIQDISVEENSPLKISKTDDETEEWVITAAESFDGAQTIAIDSGNGIMTYLQVTDITREPVAAFVEGDHTGSASFKSVDGSEFSKDVTVTASVTENGDAVSAVQAKNVLYAEFLTFNAEISEAKTGYAVNFVFPEAVKGNNYYLFNAAGNRIDGTVITTDLNEETVAAGVQFETETPGTFVFAYTQDVPESNYSYEMTADEAVNLRDLIIASGLADETYADTFIANLTGAESSDKTRLSVELVDGTCLIRPLESFRNAPVSLFLTTVYEQSAVITIIDSRPEPEADVPAEGVITKEADLTTSDEQKYHFTITYGPDAEIPADAVFTVDEVINDVSYIEQGSEKLGEQTENVVASRAFDIALRNPETGEEYIPKAQVNVTMTLIEDSVQNYDSIDIVHIVEDEQKDNELLETTVKDDTTLEFAADSFSIYVVYYTVEFEWGDYTFTITGEGEILLSALLQELNVTEITLADVAEVSFSNPEYVTVEKTEGDWLLRSVAPFESEEKLILTLNSGRSVEIKVTDEQTTAANPKITSVTDVYNADETITYTVTVEAKGDLDQPITIKGLETDGISDLTFVSGSYEYAHPEGFTVPDGSSNSLVNSVLITSGSTAFTGFPVTVSNMYDGDTVTLTYTAKVNHASFNPETKLASVTNTISITNGENDDNIKEYDSRTVTTEFEYAPVDKVLKDLDGSWASYEVTVNPKAYTLNEGNSVTIKDTFTKNQSVDYASIRATAGVTYDYSGRTGTFMVPDNTAATITYRCRITAQAGDLVTFGNTAILYAGDSEIAQDTTEMTHVIYPSASDVATTTGKYMVKVFAYADSNMQSGLSNAVFALLDQNQRAITYKTGAKAGQPVTFTTDGTGYADIALDQTADGITVEKNTVYYLEMVSAPDGYRKDTTLYSFMITDDPDYNSGGIWTYYNGDTMKVRLYTDEPGLNVTMRFAGNHELTQEQQNNITVTLQKKGTDGEWANVEPHAYSEFSYGSITFTTSLTQGETYRVVQENQRPWDLDESIALNTTYYLGLGSVSSIEYTYSPEFTMTGETVGKSVNLVIKNEYDEHKLVITKMDKETGQHLSAATFGIFKLHDNVKTEIDTAMTDENGQVIISGGAMFESETLYYITETSAPAGYYLSDDPEKTYFYFCNDPAQIPYILADLPEGETAVNLTETYDSRTLDNKREKITIPVMKTWQGNVWPEGYTVVIGLYQSVGGSEPTAVEDSEGQPLQITLSAEVPFDNHAFTELPARNSENQGITYSVREESIKDAENQEHLSEYVQEYGISDAGVYIVRNKIATSFTISKEWYGAEGQKITDPETLAQQPDVTFDLYRSTAQISAESQQGGITREEMETFVSTLRPVRTNLSFGKTDSWTKKLTDLDRWDNFGNPYYYYTVETVPSFGDEVYEVTEGGSKIVIKNQLPPEKVNITVVKAKLKDDPRPEADNTDFTFTLKLMKGSNPIRSYTVADRLTTDWNGEVTFTLKPQGRSSSDPGTDNMIVLALPKGVTATVTETPNPEYHVSVTGPADDQDTENENTYQFVVTEDGRVTFTNTLRVICKVYDSTQGKDIAFESLNTALTYIRNNENTFHGTATIEMLEDYVMPSTDVFSVRPDECITFTTATTDKSVLFHFSTTRTDYQRTALITRGGNTGSLLTNEGELNLKNIILDGNNTFVNTDGGLILSSGSLNLVPLDVQQPVILRNSCVSGRGGAIYATGTLNIPDNTLIARNEAASGSAIYIGENTTLNLTGGTISQNTVTTSTGAVVIESLTSKINLSGSLKISNNKNTSGNNANLYIGVTDSSRVEVVSPGLNANAQIGVTALQGHMEIDETFANVNLSHTDNLNTFVNDQYGYHGKQKGQRNVDVVWEGLTLTVNKTLAPQGGNENDTFTITLTSYSIRSSNYTIEGTVTPDNVITPATSTTPGSIKLSVVKPGQLVTISPLPVGTYTIEESTSFYAPTYSIMPAGSSAGTLIPAGSFRLSSDSTVNVHNTRTLVDVNLKTTLSDQLVGDGGVSLPFAVKLMERDGITPVKGFALATGIVTNEQGVAEYTVTLNDDGIDEKSFKAPYGAVMTITETVSDDYRVTTTADVTDEDTEHDNIFAFTVPNSDVGTITFGTARKAADIALEKQVTNKVSKEETFTFDITLKNSNDTPAANYVMNNEDPSKIISTDGDGKAVIPLTVGENQSSESIVLTIPEGTKLTVEEQEIRKVIDSTETAIYDTTYSVNGGDTVSGRSVDLSPVKENDSSIVFRNDRKMRQVTVTNTVGGYSGNMAPFTFTATVTDGTDNDYDTNGFNNGVQTFELATGQSKTLTVPYGSELNIAQTFIVGYETLVKHGNAEASITREDSFTVNENVTVAFTNNQLINIVLVNKTSHAFENVRIYTSYATTMYKVREDQTGQDPVPMDNHWATVSVATGESAMFAVNHENSETAEQAYTVQGNGPAEGYYYTIQNEPSFHEFADPAVLRIYDTNAYEVKGILRYSVSDSTVTFTEQPLVSFDVNGGAWTTEMDGYRDRDGDRKVYQMAVTKEEAVARPIPAPVYPTAENFPFLGWTKDKDYAEADHATDTVIDPEKAYNFETPVTEPFTLYAVWAKPARNTHTVTAKNATNNELSVTVTLTDNGNPMSNVILADGITTGADGEATFKLIAGESKNLNVPEEKNLVLSSSETNVGTYSSEFTDEDTTQNSFTINNVDRDGTVSFISGICKITDALGNVLYDEQGRPAVYTTLSAAFTAYNGTLYTNASHNVQATQAAVKMLVDEYAISSKHAFPREDMILTTAGKDDADFPYVGTRDRAVLIRSTGYINDTLFTHQSSATSVTLENIILDGGSVKINKQVNGGLIYMSYNGAVMNINSGTTLRNVQYNDYRDGNNSRAGAIYIQGGTLNVNAGLFSNLHARRASAIAVTNDAVLNITGTKGSTRFENCQSEADSGGVIDYRSNKEFTVNGGTDKDNPGIVFAQCQALGANSNGGAIYVDSAVTVSVSGVSFIECSSKNTAGNNASGFGGGAIGARNINSLTVSDSTFTACDTLKCGGAVMAYLKTNYEENNQAFKIVNCAFTNCSCKGQGGAVAVYQDNNGATESRTELFIQNTTFDNCSSGTDNGSGGAIQSYIPCLYFEETDFTDCWAGKEGGAFNNWYGGTNAVWPNSSMIVKECNFIRCRAEDRYQLENRVHYGGGFSTKAEMLLIEDSYFEDCVSTLREGGAVHCSGYGDNSSATVKNTKFKNCQAKTNGGALMASSKTMTIENSSFENCSSFAGNGGAVYHGQSVNNLKTGSELNVTDCTFSSNSAAVNGGAVWSKADTITIGTSSDEDEAKTTFTECSAAGNGGALYFTRNGNNSVMAYITGGTTISNCSAKNGSAVYQEMNVTYAETAITGNIASDINGGAIARSNGDMYFEGNVKVTGNTCSSDSGTKHNVVLGYNSNTIIRTTENGLGENAEIGIYVADVNSAYANHGKETQPFGTYGNGSGNAYLDHFSNDRNLGLYGYQQSATDNKIYWGYYLCKITDVDGKTLKRANGGDAVYQKLTLALNDFTSVTDNNGETGKAKYIKMLVEDYPIQQKEQISNFPNGDITLTTANSDDENHPYRGTPGTFCTISRTNSANQLFKLDNSNTTFQLENIILDGRRDKSSTQGNYRLIEVQNGNLVVNGGTTMQYGRVTGNNDRGGAIYATQNASVMVKSSFGNDVRFEHCYARWGGGAIGTMCDVVVASETSEDGTHSNTYFTDCSSDRGGAIIINTNNQTNLSVNGAVFEDCLSVNEGGAMFHDSTHSDSVTSLVNCEFKNCRADGSTKYSNGGAVGSRAGILVVESSSFENCYALHNGGAISHGIDNNSQNRVSTLIKGSTFNGCKTTGKNTAYGYGGSVHTQAQSVTLLDSEIRNSSSVHHGGGLYCQNNANSSNTTISGSTFENCFVIRDDGRGGAIDCRNKQLTVSTTTISNCYANSYSGAIHMEKDDNGGNRNLVLNITDGTVISECYANQGGAIYLRDTMTLNVSGSPEFTQNGYMLSDGEIIDADKGANIYLEQGSKINLSGSPKFSRNILPTRDRITNGGETDYVRQDIYLAGYNGVTNAASIHVNGDLNGDTIWVWPEQSPHRLDGEQFATAEELIGASSLEKFRNALSDNETGCSNGEYLAGVRLGSDTTNVYWSKMYNMFFNKKDNKSAAVVDAEFTLYKDVTCLEVFDRKQSADGITDVNARGELLDKGVVDFVSIPIGVYYMKETSTPAAYKPNDTQYIVLVGSPALSPTSPVYSDLWSGNGPLAVPDAPTLVQQNTINSGKYYGVFALHTNEEGYLKADVTKNYALPNIGVTNIRDDYEVQFLKLDNHDAPLPGAEFTVYVQTIDPDTGQPATYENGYPKLTPWERIGTQTTATSADGTTEIQKGVVYFPELPKGTFYLLETEYPGRNGDNRITFFVEQDRVFKLTINGMDDFVMEEWQEGGEFTPLAKNDDGTYIIRNTEAVCKLTDSNNKLLYKLGHDGKTLLPAIYESIEQGFEAAKNGVLYNARREIATSDTSPLKLKALKDFTLATPITYNSARALTFTTAERNASDTDRYIFSTNRTADTSRAEIRRGYNAGDTEPVSDALITVSGSGLTLQNVKLNGQKTTYNGRAIHVTDNGTLTIQNNTQIQNFKVEGESDGTLRGGAILMDNGTTLSINGGSANRSALFTDNEVTNTGTGSAESGAIAIGVNCTVSFANAQFTGNSVAAPQTPANGNGGAISLPVSAANQTYTFSSVVFRNNSATGNGGAINTADNCKVSIVNDSIFTSNHAGAENGEGGAIRIGTGGTLNLIGTAMTGNTAARGGAVYTAPGSSAAFTTSRITGNSGGAVYPADSTSKLYFGGSIYIFDNLDGGVQKNVVLCTDSNDVIHTTDGGLFSNAKIGIYVMDGPEGTLFRTHGLAGMPFGTFANPNYLNNFWNDRIPTLYGVRHETEEENFLIYWVNLGGSVAFKKIDSFGEVLDGAAFTLYTDAACTEIYEKPTGETATAVSADGTTIRNQNNELLNKGTVLFETLPEGVYYMKETKSDGTSGAPGTYAENTAVYIVLVGDSAMIRPQNPAGTIWAQGNVLGDITQEMVNAQKTRYTTDKAEYKLSEDPNYAVFRIDATTNRAAAVPDIAAYGVLNEPDGLHKVVIRKGDIGLDPLEGAVFDVLKYDRTVIAENMTSLADGVIWIGELAPGQYYLHETAAPAGYTVGQEGKWFVFTVTREGVVIATSVIRP